MLTQQELKEARQNVVDRTVSKVLDLYSSSANNASQDDLEALRAALYTFLWEMLSSDKKHPISTTVFPLLVRMEEDLAFIELENTLTSSLDFLPGLQETASLIGASLNV